MAGRMKKIPDIVIKAWNDRKGPIIFSTVSDDAIPNAVYASCVSLLNDNKILITNNFFDKTLKNILSGSMGSVLFITKDDKAYQIKGSVNYFREGEAYENMKTWNPGHLPGHGVAVMAMEEIYAGAEKIY
jgi:predicted pyridoxine 5'-phosphate oxidase superfamily flavin-nucleotide-binding protein